MPSILKGRLAVQVAEFPKHFPKVAPMAPPPPRHAKPGSVPKGPPKGAAIQPKAWTEIDDGILRTLWGTMSLSGLARRLRCAQQTVTRHAERLGLT